MPTKLEVQSAAQEFAGSKSIDMTLVDPGSGVVASYHEIPAWESRRFDMGEWSSGIASGLAPVRDWKWVTYHHPAIAEVRFTRKINSLSEARSALRDSQYLTRDGDGRVQAEEVYGLDEVPQDFKDVVKEIEARADIFLAA